MDLEEEFCEGLRGRGGEREGGGLAWEKGGGGGGGGVGLVFEMRGGDYFLVILGWMDVCLLMEHVDMREPPGGKEVIGVNSKRGRLW